MFSAPETDAAKGTFRAQIIHFGGSMNGLNFDAIPAWLSKFEGVLRGLYWVNASAHILTDYIDGAYQFNWSAHRDILATHIDGCPTPTNKWVRCDDHRERRTPPHA
jgi:uncharacterized protein with von Willebrand factor type A (vWA) domain